MSTHLVVPLLGAILVGAALLVFRVYRYRHKKRNHAAVVQKAVAQMRQTGIFLSLGMNPDPEEISLLQMKLKRDWGYQGEIDGHPNTQMLEAIERMATARGIDVESEAMSLFPRSRSAEVLPAEIHKEIVLSAAQAHLEGAQTGRNRGHRIA